MKGPSTDLPVRSPAAGSPLTLRAAVYCRPSMKRCCVRVGKHSRRNHRRVARKEISIDRFRFLAVVASRFLGRSARSLLLPNKFTQQYPVLGLFTIDLHGLRFYQSQIDCLFLDHRSRSLRNPGERVQGQFKRLLGRVPAKQFQHIVRGYA